MSLVAGGARGGSHRVDPAKDEGLLIHKSLAEMESSRRRSLRKREEKSYVESPDLIFEEEGSSHKRGMALGASGLKTVASVISNGDVEMESDDDDEPLDPLPLPKELPPDALQERKALIRKLQTQLRNEEMSLVLLKKIRQSQVIADQVAAAAAVKAAGGSSAVPNNSHHSSRDATGYTQHRGTPPPGSAKVGMSHKTNQGSRHQGHQGSPTPAQIKNLMPDLSQLKPVSVDPKSLPPGLPASLMSMINKSVAAASTGGSGGKMNDTGKVQKVVDTETPQQKQAAAKLALRKQLEKTLLQIPPPKPPPPEMHFIPNPANTEFICLLGLEECVGKILHENKENTVQPIPFTCSQCATDFTPTWKWDKGARGKEVKVICEACVTSNVKKALKAEHTNRLKAAFVKALQQEQELEAHMAAQASQQAAQSSGRGSSPDVSSARSRTGTSALPASLDVTVRPSTATVRSIPSAHQQPPSRMTSSTPSVTIERAHHHQQQQHRGMSSSSSNRSSAASITPRHSSSNLSRMGGSGMGSSTPPLNNSVSVTSTNASRSSGKNDQSSAAAAMAAAARDSANAMAAATALMGGMGGYDPASMALLQAAAQQQMLMGAYGTTATTGGTNSVSTSRSSGNSGSSGSNASNNAAAAALSSQLAAMSQHLMNPLLYNYQALAMAQAMQAAGLTGLSSTTSSSSRTNNTSSNSSGGGKNSSNSSSQSATNQMLEIQRQVAAAEQLQRQYLLDMIPPGSLGQSWGKK